ncbi:transposase [Candidatus Enterovibrio escicola]|uniref:transposase n=1 Tax=Candidatus Enterovibrio escicola TaxID=1927127 RepID=UPI001237DF63
MKGKVNTIGAIINHTFLTLSLVIGNVNAEVFHVWIEQNLLPKVPEEAVIVIDHASFHKHSDILESIEARSCASTLDH